MLQSTARQVTASILVPESIRTFMSLTPASGQTISLFQGLNGLGILSLQLTTTIMDTVISPGVELTSGTHVAGTIRSDPYGVLPNGKIYAVKVHNFNIELTF